jgi:hypothetical protein
VAAVDEHRRLREDAALADLDGRRALDEHVVGEDGSRPDDEAPVAVYFRTEAAAELHSRADDQRPGVWDQDAEPGAEVHRPLELDVGVGMAQLEPPAAQPRGEPRPLDVRDAPCDPA